MTKVLIVVDSLAFGGAERQAVELARGLRTGHTVQLASLRRIEGGYLPLLEDSAIEHHCFPRRFALDPLPLMQLTRLLKQGRFDVVHTFMNMGSIFGLLAARAARIPVVCSPYRDAHPGTMKSESIKRFVALFADLCVANSKAGFNARYSKWRPSFRVVYNGLNEEHFLGSSDSSEGLRKELALDRFSGVVGMVGRLSHHKDHKLLLEVTQELVQHRPRTGLLIVGDGPNRRALEALSLQIGLSKNVVFTGFRSDAAQLYPLLDVAVLLTDTDHADEGTPNAVIEPMAAGLPVVATRCGGTPETINHGVDGFLVEPKDIGGTSNILLRLLNNRELASRVGAAARTSALHRFSLRRYIDDCESLYREALKLRSGTAKGEECE